MKGMALYGERKAFYDTKTTCFGIMMLNGTFLRTSINSAVNFAMMESYWLIGSRL